MKHKMKREGKIWWGNADDEKKVFLDTDTHTSLKISIEILREVENLYT